VRKLSVLIVLLVLAAGVGQATAVARGGDPDVSALVDALRNRAASGEASAVLEAAQLVAEDGGDPNTSPLVDELTGLYEASPALALREQELEKQVAAGDPAAVFAAASAAQLAGLDSSPLADKLTKVWDDVGRAAWVKKLEDRARNGDLKAVLGTARLVALTGADPEGSQLVQQLTDLLNGKQKQPPAKLPGGGTSKPGSDSSSAGSGGSDAKPDDERGEAPGREPSETHPHGGSGSGSSESGGETERYHVTIKEGGTVVGEGTKTVTPDDKGGQTTVTEISYRDGSKEKTTTVEDENGNVVSETIETTSAEGTTSTTECTGECPDDEMTNPEQDDQTPAFDDLSALERPTGHQMREHPTNNPEDTGGGGDVDGDGKPELEPGHLDGKIDPQPDSEVAILTGTPVVNHFNGAGPEFGPDGPQQPETGGDVPLQNGGNGPIENPQLSFRP
jgi:hypothetical protein